MDTNSIARKHTIANFAPLVPEMTVSETSNPVRYVVHPSGWRFIVEVGCFGPIVLAAPPGHNIHAHNGFAVSYTNLTLPTILRV